MCGINRRIVRALVCSRHSYRIIILDDGMILPCLRSITISEDTRCKLGSLQYSCEIPTPLNADNHISGGLLNRLSCRIIAGQETKDSGRHRRGIDLHTRRIYTIQDLDCIALGFLRAGRLVIGNISQYSGTVIRAGLTCVTFLLGKCMFSSVCGKDTSVISASYQVVLIILISMVQLRHDAAGRSDPCHSIGGLQTSVVPAVRNRSAGASPLSHDAA